MENRAISASLSTQSLTFRPGKSVSLEVTVINSSNQFAAFQLEVLAAGASKSGPLWYRLSPEVAAAKPPGGITRFQVIIFDSPLTAFVGAINLTVRIFSPQLRQERKLLVRLTIEAGQMALLGLDLPVRQFQVYPRNLVDILVRVQNISPKAADVVLRLTGLDSSWLVGGVERRLFIEPGVQTEITFQCQPPPALQAPSQNYAFTVEALSRDSASTRIDGSLEVLPVGFIEFTVTPQQQTIPSSKWWLHWKSDSALFQLLFKNTSNLRQQINLQLQGRDWQKCSFRVLPTGEVAQKSIPEVNQLQKTPVLDCQTEVGSGETAKVSLEVRTKRPWLGLGKNLWIEAKTLLSDRRLGSTDPATGSLELKVMPIVPLWLAIALIALLAAILWLLFKPAAIAHTDSVRSVRFDGSATFVLSGSDDCTVRHWLIKGDRLEPWEILNHDAKVICKGKEKPLNPKGVLAVANEEVKSLRLDPVDQQVDKQKVAVGLKDGTIQILEVSTGDKKDELRDSTGLADWVTGLVFTTKKSQFLFSGHSSGKVRVWERASFNKFNSVPKTYLKLNFDYAINAIALNEDESILATVGRYKNIILWDKSHWEQSNTSSQPIKISLQGLPKDLHGEKQGQNDYIWGLAFVPGAPNLLATSDSDGVIAIWELDNCQASVSRPEESVEKKCELRDSWQAAESTIRSLAFSEDGQKLVSGGDDGRVVVWPLTPQKKLDRTAAINGREIYISSQKINSVALTKDNQGMMVVSGSDDFQVRLHRLSFE